MRHPLGRRKFIRVKLAGLLAQGVELSQQQAALAASKQETTKKIQAPLAEGNRLVTSMRRMIADQYGITSEKLTEFGIQPFRGRTRTPSPAPQPESPAPEESLEEVTASPVGAGTFAGAATFPAFPSDPYW
jgi:hypothetical protein